MALIATPVGGVRIEGDERHVDRIRIEPDTTGEIVPRTATLGQAVDQLLAWFAGDRTRFDLPLAPAITARGQVLRDGLVGIKYGETISYGDLARLINTAARAMGQACARNPLPIVVPCHRVLNADRSLGHYSGGDGPNTKRWLLEHERRISRNSLL